MMMLKDEEAKRVADEFIAAINARDLDRLAGLMTDDHRFVDATGAVHVGRETMRTGWEGYFAAFPQYRIEAETTVASEPLVLLCGWATGTSKTEPGPGKGRSWRIPAAWKAVVREGRMAEWQVYCDVEPMLRSVGLDRW